MSTIGKPDVGTGGHWTGPFSTTDGRGDVGKRREAPGQRPHGLADEIETVEKAALFARRLHGAAREHSSDARDDDAPSDPLANARLIAFSGFIGTGLPAPADAAPASSPPGTDRQAVISALADRVETAIRAEIAPPPGTPLRLSLAFADAVAGLRGLTVSMTPTALDIILVRGAGDLSPDLIAAAQGLADRLRLRFGRQVVRVHDVVEADAPPSGLAGLFRHDEKG